MKKSNLQLAAALVVASSSFGVFIWAGYQLFSSGIRASDAEATGGADQIVQSSQVFWVWLFASLGVLVAAVALLTVTLLRSYWRARAIAPSAASNDATANTKNVPWARTIVDYFNPPQHTRGGALVGRWLLVAGVVVLIAGGALEFALSRVS